MMFSLLPDDEQGEWSDCALGHVAYKPKVGDALMFYDRTPDYMNEVKKKGPPGCI